MQPTCSQISLEEHPSDQSPNLETEENIRWSHDEKCESSESMRCGAVHDQMSNNEPFSVLQSCSRSAIQIPNKDESSSDSQQDHEHNPVPKTLNPEYILTINKSSEALIISRRRLLPLSTPNPRTLTGGIVLSPDLDLPYLNYHTGTRISNSQNVPNPGTYTALSLRSATSLLRHFLLSQVPHGLSSVFHGSLLPAIESSSGSSASQQSSVSTFSSDNGLRDETQIAIMRQLLVDLAIYMHRLSGSPLESSMPMVLSGGSGVNFRLVTENVRVPTRTWIFYEDEVQNQYRDMRLDVDDMSYEELLALEDRIGYVSTGLSEDALASYLKHSKYYLFNEENSKKESCSICQEDYMEEEELGTLDCGHNFHIACIEQWLKCKNICPICKATALCTTEAILPEHLS